MIEIRKTDVFAQSLDELRDIKARARVQARIERLAQVTQAMSSRSVKAYRNCESIMDLVTGCTSKNEGKR